jgi:type III pantothenate kinase
VPRVVFNLRVLASRYFDCRPAGGRQARMRPAGTPRVDQGTTVGPDRLVNRGAHDRHGGDLIVVDFGTATTFDVVDSDGAYIGGVIAPGVNLSPGGAAHGRRRPAACRCDPPAAGDRHEYGGLHAVGRILGLCRPGRGIVREIRAERGRPMKVIGTGGLAPLFDQGEALFDTVEDDLTMHGLTVIHATTRNWATHEQ